MNNIINYVKLNKGSIGKKAAIIVGGVVVGFAVRKVLTTVKQRLTAEVILENMENGEEDIDGDCNNSAGER